MSTNVIKQTLVGEPGMQTIKQIVRSNERGPQGPQGEPGPQGPQGLPGERGADGVIQYRAGTGIDISDENIISATGEATTVWGGIQGSIENQTDLAPYIENLAPERIWYGICETSADQTQEIVTTTTGDFGFKDGDAIVVQFVYNHTVYGEPKLVVDGGAPVSTVFIGDWRDGPSYYWAAGEPVMFIYHILNPNTARFYPVGKAHASTSATGVVKLYDGTDSTSKTMAPTAKALKTTYDAIGTKIATALAGTGYVGTTNIADGAVTAAKIADNAVTTGKIIDDAVTADKIDFTTFGGGNYSLTEQNTGFTWVDGKPIYKITLYCSSLSAGGTDVMHGISNLDLCIKAEVFEIAASHTTLLLPAMANTSGGNYVSPWVVSNTAIKFFLSIPLTDVYITLYYTKTS